MGKRQKYPEKTIGGKRYRTLPFGAIKQIQLLPMVTRLAAGPLGSGLEMLKGMGEGPLGDLLKKRQAAKKSGEDFDITEHVKANEMLGAMKPQAITQAMLGIANELETVGPEGLMELLENTFQLKSKGMRSCSKDFDDLFQSDLMTLGQVLIWVVQMNFAPFLPSKNDPSDGQPQKNELLLAG